jgi:hypothetical protein
VYDVNVLVSLTIDINSLTLVEGYQEDDRMSVEKIDISV